MNVKEWPKKAWEKLKEVGRKVKNRIRSIAARFTAWCVTHEAEVRKYAPVLVAGMALVGKEMLRRSKENHDFRKKECWHYDRRTSEWVRSKRKLKNHEADYLEEMYRQGYSKRQILDAMDLLR